MRKVLLVVALVAASFAGGAAVNGPGLHWLKGLIHDRLNQPGEAIPTLDVDTGDDLAMADVKPSSGPQQAPDEPKVSDPPSDPAPPLAELPKAEPEAPAPATDAPEPKAAEPPPLADPEPAPAPAPAPRAKPAAPSPLPALPVPPAASPRTSPRDKATAKTGWEDAPGNAPTTAVLPKKMKPSRPEAPATADSAVAAAAAPVPASDPGPGPAPDPASTLAEPPPLAPSSPAPAPNPNPSPNPATEPGAMPVPPVGVATASPTLDWASLRKRMATLGVREYEFKGTPSGAVKFKCLVPGAPNEAARPFEAEGDDELQAADMALRRVAVWKATRRVKG